MRKHPALAVLFAWLVPGAGHVYLGQWVKGACFGFLLIAVFTFGVLLTDGACVDLGRHPWAFALQAGEGIAAAVALVLTRGAVEPPASKLNDLGMLLTLVGGAMNVLLIADVLYRTGPAPAKEAS
jgi:hypothetical protein